MVVKMVNLLVIMLSSIGFLLQPVASLNFNFSTFTNNVRQGDCPPGTKVVCLQGDASINNVAAIELTQNNRGLEIGGSVGRALYSEPVRLWDNSTADRVAANFSTEFTFIINDLGNTTNHGDGIALFLAPYQNPSRIPANSSGGYLGLASSWNAFNSSGNTSFVAVELDNYQNGGWDPSSDHVGININSVRSVSYVNLTQGFNGSATGKVRLAYNSNTHNLTVSMLYSNYPFSYDSPILSHIVDLRDVLPERVVVGLSGTTGLEVELHCLFSWSFNSTLEEDEATAAAVNKTSSKLLGPVVGVAVGVGVLLVGLGVLFWFVRWGHIKGLNKAEKEEEEEDLVDDDGLIVDDELEKGRGPRRFSYQELVAATGNFKEEGKLGEGGFGPVYRGYLSGPEAADVAIKRVSKGSKQGKKEYVAEVRIISRLRHRNLVQLMGWCHGRRQELLLVYEFMPNGSLDAHLFNAGGDDGIKSAPPLPWPVRYKTASGLASALLYLHEEWEQCVVHRDVKSSNIMLDAAFNAKLGDFGLARFAEHGGGMQTTMLAGTMGYMAPECFITGKASKESDVYSFGVVALEVACGRKCVEPKEEEGRVRLVEWVWGLYGKGSNAMLEEAADSRLAGDYDAQQMERLMVVGLWCAHPDLNVRPSIRQAINVLHFEAPMPSLPLAMPVPVFFSSLPSVDMGYSTTTGLSSTSTTISAATTNTFSSGGA